MTKYKYAGVHNLRNPGICILNILFIYIFLLDWLVRFWSLHGFGRDFAASL